MLTGNTLVPAGSQTTLPSFPQVVLPKNEFVLPRTALRSSKFRSPRATALFSKEDVIASEVTGGVVYLTGTLDRPTGLNIVLANAVSGDLEVVTLACADRCELKDGLVLDRAGPFGTIRQVNVGVDSERETCLRRGTQERHDVRDLVGSFYTTLPSALGGNRNARWRSLHPCYVCLAITPLL